ncbi:hypothetical protein BDV93DRAFT_479145 [Ceratobasidium sp. AG-I]|nr:hypothetical protein BDV93DRAFT_479145 [Ceratobasidium sp. AG-I]
MPAPMTKLKTPLYAPQPVFDAGLNSSNAWKKHLSITDAETSSDDTSSVDEKPPLARAVRDVLGNDENREMGLRAGEEVEILNANFGESWSLAQKQSGDMGLIPCDSYVTTLSFAGSPVQTSPTTTSSQQAGDGPIRMQSTGESSLTSSFNNLRQSVLGGRSMNRFSHFVTTGAEDWVLNGYQPIDDTSTTGSHMRDNSDATMDGSDLDASRITEADKHYVESGPSWKTKSPPFRVLVHSPSKCSSVTGAYTLYSVTSLFQTEEEDNAQKPAVPYLRPEFSESSTRITVLRRFSHFAFLHTALSRKLPGIALPPLPAKQYAGRFQGEFVEARRNDLERWLARVVRHPVARYSEVLTFFLGCESDLEWRRLLPHHLNTLPAGPVFYAHVFHPEFNLDADDCLEVVNRFERHVRGVDTRIDVLRAVMGQFRETRNAMSKAQRNLSLAFLSLITEGQDSHQTSAEEDDSIHEAPGYLNDELAWCWHDGCEECLQMTKALQKMSECMQLVAALHEDSAKRSMLSVHEMIKDASHPSVVYAPVVETHRAALSRYQENENNAAAKADAPEVAARCETVLNTTMAEFDTYHDQRGEDVTQIAVEYLDSEIEFYEQVIQKLRNARSTFTTEGAAGLPKGPRQPSMYEKNIRAPPQPSAPLPQPTSHIYDPAPIRPVSTAVRESVGLLIDGLTHSTLSDGENGRNTLLKFWS